jgi:hypothetical protein
MDASHLMVELLNVVASSAPLITPHGQTADSVGSITVVQFLSEVIVRQYPSLAAVLTYSSTVDDPNCQQVTGHRTNGL